MKIGIDASRAFIKKRTGIEEYSYQTIKHLRDKLVSHQVVLYLRKNHEVDFEIPVNWKIKVIKWPRFWTQIGLSLEMLFHPVDVLFVPAHTVPFVHPSKTVVTIHGLEYEFIKNGYSWWERFYMRLSIKKSCQWASEIISVSQNTKKDLVDLYKASLEKIKVIYEGYSHPHVKSSHTIVHEKSKIQNLKFLLFIGRIEERKNIVNIVRAFEILKEKYQIPHKLVLAGKPGYGHEVIKSKVESSKFKDEIVELGYVSEEEKWELLRSADCFVFPTLYEGFGIPVLEAQSMGCPVVAANNSSVREIASQSAFLVDEKAPQDIAENIWKLLSDEKVKNDIIAKGLDNVKRFSWEKNAEQIAEVLTQ